MTTLQDKQTNWAVRRPCIYTPFSEALQSVQASVCSGLCCWSYLLSAVRSDCGGERCSVAEAQTRPIRAAWRHWCSAGSLQNQVRVRTGTYCHMSLVSLLLRRHCCHWGSWLFRRFNVECGTVLLFWKWCNKSRMKLLLWTPLKHLGTRKLWTPTLSLL